LPVMLTCPVRREIIDGPLNLSEIIPKLTLIVCW
jgi:hypothetical protein